MNPDVPVHQYDSLMYASPSVSHHVGSPMAEAPWRPHQSPENSSTSSGHSSHIYTAVNHSADRVGDYASPGASAAFTQNNLPGTYVGADQSPLLHSNPSEHEISFSQMEGGIRPSRVQTRRQRAAQMAAVEHGPRRDSVSAQSSMSVESHENTELAEYFPGASVSRPQTPSNAVDSTHYQQQPRRLSLSMLSSAIPMPLQSPRYSSTPGVSPVYPPYGFFSSHSRSTSSSNSASNSASNPRSASPAQSATSAHTSVSTSPSGSGSQIFQLLSIPPTGSMSPLSDRPKQRKQRLFNVDRKRICEFHLENPNLRQEDIAARYNVERSTISKILKNKVKWLNVPASESLRVARHRPSKFPEVEVELKKWLEQLSQTRTHITDAMIRDQAKAVAKYLNISEDKFKASAGWIENFKSRHGVRKGVWTGDPKIRVTRNPVAGARCDDGGDMVLSPLNPAFDTRSDIMDNKPYDMDMEYSVDSEGSPDPSIGQQEHGEQASPSMSLRPAWPSHTPTSGDVSVSSTHSVTGQETSGIMHNTVSEQSATERHHRHQSDTVMHLDNASHPRVYHADSQQPILSKSEPYHGPHRGNAYAPPLQVFQELPLNPFTSPTTPSEVEDAINKVIGYVDAQPPGAILGDTDRSALIRIRYALIQADNPVAYSRET